MVFWICASMVLYVAWFVLFGKILKHLPNSGRQGIFLLMFGGLFVFAITWIHDASRWLAGTNPNFADHTAVMVGTMIYLVAIVFSAIWFKEVAPKKKNVRVIEPALLIRALREKDVGRQFQQPVRFFTAFPIRSDSVPSVDSVANASQVAEMEKIAGQAGASPQAGDNASDK